MHTTKTGTSAGKVKGFIDGKGGNTNREQRWLTPPYIPEAFGHFDLDPCGAPGHNLADYNYLLESGEDGLALPWTGRVWLNPPYGREAAPFLQRLADHGHGTALTFARTETRMFRESVWERASAVLFLYGRLKFLDEDGLPAPTNGGAPSVLIAYGDADTAALKNTSLKGHFVRLR